jgi:hypothetical protein
VSILQVLSLLEDGARGLAGLSGAKKDGKRRLASTPQWTPGRLAPLPLIQ